MAPRKSKSTDLKKDLPTESLDGGQNAGQDDDGASAKGEDGQSDNDDELVKPKTGRKSSTATKSDEEAAANKVREKAATEAVSHVRSCAFC